MGNGLRIQVFASDQVSFAVALPQRSRQASQLTLRLFIPTL